MSHKLACSGADIQRSQLVSSLIVLTFSKSVLIPTPKTTMDDSQGGSIILIDPTTSGIIGTLTPASPSPETEGKSDDQVAHPTPQESGPTEGGDEILTPTPQRRDPTYSYRLSISDLSLRTFAGASADAEQSSQYPPASVMGTPSGATRTDAKLKDRKSQLRSSWMTDDASFWTARGTLRLDGPVEAGEEREREVVVAYVKTDTSVSPYFPWDLANTRS